MRKNIFPLFRFFRDFSDPSNFLRFAPARMIFRAAACVRGAGDGGGDVFMSIGGEESSVAEGGR